MEDNSAGKMSYEWIDPDLMNGLAEETLLLFGAGRGSEELLSWLETSRPRARVAAIADNDASMWGKTLHGHEIIPPYSIREFGFEKIVVTSVSGAQAIGLQLKGMGFKESEFLQVGRCPADVSDNFRTLKKELTSIGKWREGLRCLHVGPGGFLGIECLLHSLVADHVTSIDKFAFAIHYPDITPRFRDYRRIRDLIPNEVETGHDAERALARFDGLFLRRGERFHMDTKKIDFQYPVDVCSMPFPPESFDLVVSFAILEHVRSPDLAVSEIARVLRKGGAAVHTIITTDHRSFSKVKGFTPFSFRVYSSSEWEAIARKKFYQNRLLPIQWRRLFEEKGLKVENYTVGERVEASNEVLLNFHSDFGAFSREDLCDINCRIAAVKGGSDHEPEANKEPGAVKDPLGYVSKG